MKKRTFNWAMKTAIVQGLLFSILGVAPSASIAGIVGDATWQVEKGDTVYSIARKVFPDDAGKQRRFRKELVNQNVSVFNDDPSRLSIGQKLVLPAFAVSKPVVPAVVTSQEPAQETVKQVVPVVTAKPESPVTPDPEEVIGRVVVSMGKMEASNRGVFRDLKRHSDIIKGDTISTAQRAYTQIRMKDGALISLRPGTKLKITDYNFNGSEDGTERSFMELLSGGFRTITGYIGHRNKQNYRVKTSVATIGIRGTHYGLMLCQAGNCQGKHGGPDEGLEDGMYGGVVDGSIVVDNDAGRATFNNDQYFHVASHSANAVERLVPPPIFHGRTDSKMAHVESKSAEKAGHILGPKQNRAEQKLEELAQGGQGTGGKSAEQQRQMAFDQRVNGETGKQVNKAFNVAGAMSTMVKTVVDDFRPPVVAQDQGAGKPGSAGNITGINQDVVDAINTAEEFGGEAKNLIQAPDGAGALVALSTIDNTGQQDNVAAQIIAGVNGSNILLGEGIDAAAGTTIGNLPVFVEDNEGGNKHIGVLPSGVNGIRDIGGFGANGIGVNWGRWDADAGYELTENGQPIQTFGDLHYIYSDKLTTPTELANLDRPVALGGLLAESYTKIGGTMPTNAAGNFATLNNLSMVADFQSQKVLNYDIEVQDGGALFHMGANNIPFSSAAGQDIRDFDLQEVSIGCTAGPCMGRASVAFVGGKAEGAMTTYSIQEVGGPKGANGAAFLLRTTGAGVIPQ